jgi:hypothetical protein
MMSREHLQIITDRDETLDFDVSGFEAGAALGMIDGIITDIYLPFRGQAGYGTERAVLVEPPHVPHRENDAEHSWHLGLTIQVLWDNREALGIEFPESFDVAKAVQLAAAHDILEIWDPDVDAVTPNAEHLHFKKAREQAARRSAI